VAGALLAPQRRALSLRAVIRCAIYTRVSTEHGLDQEFNSLDAQYDAASAYIKSQAHAGWTPIRSRYDDGGYSGGSTDRPDLQRLLDDIAILRSLFGRRIHLTDQPAVSSFAVKKVPAINQLRSRASNCDGATTALFGFKGLG
jgi:hypothetical protein